MHWVAGILGLFFFVAFGIGTVFVKGWEVRLKLLITGASVCTFFVCMGGALLWHS